MSNQSEFQGPWVRPNGNLVHPFITGYREASPSGQHVGTLTAVPDDCIPLVPREARTRSELPAADIDNDAHWDFAADLLDHPDSIGLSWRVVELRSQAEGLRRDYLVEQLAQAMRDHGGNTWSATARVLLDRFEITPKDGRA